MAENQCVNCGGTGLVWLNSKDHHTCEVCGGHGVVGAEAPVSVESVPDAAPSNPEGEQPDESEKKTGSDV